jgi:single-stranded-DNA-specific exonuclease
MEKRLSHRDQAPLLKSFSKIAAIATVADSVPLTGENRVFAKLGLDALRTAKNPGLKALLDVAQLGGRALSSGEVAFRVAPRINAAGRMDIAADVIELFSTKDESQAKLLAGKLDRLNAERQEEERRILESINKRLEEEPALRDAYCIVLDGEGWHRGVVGITATRVVERYHRPAIVISCDGEQAHGSGRSIRPFHLLNALESCPELFTRYGGHSHAVGFSMPTAQVGELRKRLDAYAHNCLTPSDLEPVLELDAMVPFDHITPDLFQALQRMEPFGVGNREPIFAANNVRVTASPRIMKEKHAKLKLAFNGQVEGEKWRRSIRYDALGWHMAEQVQQAELALGDVLDVAFILESNDHSDFGGLELTLRDFRVAEKVAVERQGGELLVSGSTDA